jgi:thiamine pyrophosphate-dependent acetolactate synthase large subunit-like protein
VDICAEELHNSVTSNIAIQADIRVVAEILTTRLKSKKYSFNKDDAWWQVLRTKGNINKDIVNVGFLIRT